MPFAPSIAFYFRFINCLFIICLPLIHTSGQTKEWDLPACIQEGLQNNLFIKNVALNTEISNINIQQSRASRLPNLNANLGHNFQFGRSIDPSTNQFLQQSVQTNNAGLSSSVILFNGMQQVNIIRQNRLNYESGKYDIENTKNDVMLQITANYLQIILNKEIAESAKIQYLNTEAQLSRTEKLVSAGSLPELNLFQIKSQLAQDKLAIAQADNQITLAKVALMQAMNIPVTPQFEIQKTNIPEPSTSEALGISTTEIYGTAIQNQPQIKSAELLVNSAMMGVKVAQGGYLPRLTLFANVSTFYSSANKQMQLAGVRVQPSGYLANDPTQIVNSNLPNYIFNDYPFFNQMKDKLGEQVGLALAVPIFNGRQANSNVQRNRVNTEIAKNNEQNTKNQLRQSIEQAAADLRAATNNYIAAKESLVFSDAAYLNSEKRFNAGLMNTTDFLIQKNNVFTSKISVSQAKYDCFFKLKLLEFYQGKSISF